MLADGEEQGLLTAATLHDQLSNPALANFLYSVACAERLAADSASSQALPQGEEADDAEGDAGEGEGEGGAGDPEADANAGAE